jgi:hypothetical protein
MKAEALAGRNEVRAAKCLQGRLPERLLGYFSASGCFTRSAGTSCCFIRLL